MQRFHGSRPLLATVVLAGFALAGAAHAQCVGDCSGDGEVTVDEIVTGLSIALGNAGIEVCPAFDANVDGQVTVDEIVTSVNNALNGCPACGDCDDGNACTEDLCVDGACVHEPVICPDDGEECTAEFCDPATGCGSTNVADGTSCSGGVGVCQAGVCVASGCTSNDDCDDDNACTTDFCIDNACLYASVTCPDDGNECTAEACNSAVGCESTNVADGTLCLDATGVCRDGVCATDGEIRIEYQQDFEALDAGSDTALGDDGWVVFGNVFSPQGTFLFGYGPFAAPNNSGAFSGIDTGQGGAEQGAQQLVIFNDYNAVDQHEAGNLVESNVFRERRITAADSGRTLTFSFDAKRGNINDPDNPLCPCDSTALGFIKTLNPAANFALTNFVQVDTTELPETWGRLELSLAIDAGLVGQLLQVGFANTTTRFQPSAVFYDNIDVRSVPTVP